IWTIMERFGYPTLLNELNDANIHRLENIMTLGPSFHNWFDMLSTWLEEQVSLSILPTDIAKLVQPTKPHTYKIKFRSPLQNLDNRCPELISFESKHKHLPLPSPTYLRIHAACARVCHLSGAAEYIDKYERDGEYQSVIKGWGICGCTPLRFTVFII
ncbi:hypothetical protein BU17DRAFT_45677, partial [Hysterangium stoloniferum]